MVLKVGDSVLKRFKEARIAKGIKLSDATALFGVSQPTISAWETERKAPSIDTLIKMAEIYGVSIDYLLGVDAGIVNPNEPIPVTNITLFHGKPVWVDKYGWAILDAANHELVFIDKKIPITDVLSIYACAPKFAESPIPKTSPLTLSEVKRRQQVWLEPISNDADLRIELRGWYTIKDRFAENEYGNRFYFDLYGSKWIAFDKNIG